MAGATHTTPPNALAEIAAPADTPELLPLRSRGHWWTRYAVVLIVVAMIVVFSFTNPSTFPSVLNMQVILGSNSVTLLLALASLPPLIAGDFDLSVGYNLEVSAVLMASLVGPHHMDAVPAAVITLAFGTLVGLINGLLVAKAGISSFIATIGVGSALAGMSLYLTNGSVLIENIPDWLKTFSQTNSGGIPNLVYASAVAVLIFWVVFEHTPYGRKMLAIGLSRRSTEILGVRVVPLRASAFVVAGFLSSLTGLLQLGRIGSASSGVGPSFLLPAVAAGFLGATTIKVGRFNVIGTLVAVLLVAIGVSGLELNGVPNWVEPVFDGVVLVLAVGTSRLATRRNR
jgi:ribose transport system permease protein